MAKQKKIETDISTEEKIKEAARKVFTQKGYAATRTRDIAEEAGLNLALLNYYFRSKEKLFEIVMLEKVQQLFGIVAPILIDTTTTIDQKVTAIANNYIEMLLHTPDLPLFVLSEIRNNPERFSNLLQVGELMKHSHFVKQLKEKVPNVNPIHFLLNILSMSIFPFVASPILQTTGLLQGKAFNDFVAERKKLIPIWVRAMLKSK